MKLIRAEFENFRLLRHLRLDFSTSETKKLTVIRAENETGKTTVLNGLQWALYGDVALPEGGNDYRLHPIDWDTADGNRVLVTAMVEFETIATRKGPNGTIETKRVYRIIRSVHESVDGSKWERGPSTVRLFNITEAGADPIDPPEAFINEELPPELREVFFTDGDRALSFIEATVSVSTKRERVSRAIRSLLGLEVIEEALRHVKKAASEVNRAAKSLGTDQKLISITTKLEQIEKDTGETEGRIEDSKKQFAAFDQKLAELQKKIDAALVKGDREKLKTDIERALLQIKQIDESLKQATKAHSSLFRSMSLSRDLLKDILSEGLGKLDKLRDQGKIPNTTIPVLEERLRSELCICGESLDANKPGGTQRRDHIRQLIEDSRKADELQSRITDLYYGARVLQIGQATEEEGWLSEYAEVGQRRDQLETLRKEQGKVLKSLEVQLDDIPDVDIQGLRGLRKEYMEHRDQHNENRVRYETVLESLEEERESLEQQRDNLLRQQEKGARILGELEVTQDIQQVLQNAYNRITGEELAKVSTLMNDTFLEMIGADPEQGAIIRKAEISKDFDILVSGPNNRDLNPDRDLNGASRRALTLSFILALTKVSEVEAANVIDTPLGMMSGYIKKSVLETAIRESSQLILLLTRSEIKDCEEILDREAGMIITLSNSSHYPKMLVNDPKAKERTVIRCNCSHRKVCEICQRRDDLEP